MDIAACGWILATPEGSQSRRCLIGEDNQQSSVLRPSIPLSANAIFALADEFSMRYYQSAVVPPAALTSARRAPIN
ncbi:hypothetical protein EVAR_70738_1 [Eumeta japonica]|uniref:Uncharacterized protein n=1 Tax=Eumeta variegata TaxID=151549 RepID=A0A4C2AGI3_EUMVA|nr:hypothetical protein EVAR_70738_1 [Eumeta japonica]